MTANAHDPAALKAFEAFLDVHGANRSRWPAQQRLQFASLLASSGEARRLLAEAEALERLIGTIDSGETAETRTPAKQALTDRIMMAALSERQTAPAPRQPADKAVVPPSNTAVRELDGEAVRVNVVPLRPAPLRRSSLWPVGAMMAASLLLGITTGVSAMLTIGSGVDTAAAEAATETTYDPAVIALDNDSYGLLGGDLL